MSRAMKPRGSIAAKEEEEARIGNDPNLYQVGAEIGRGGFGVVFQAFNVRTGDFVAVKRFPLHSIDKESLNSIESEIELMQKLNHPNIVKYIDTIRTKSYLYIVLEYMENGSLATVIKKFGFFTESLTAIYVTQVLRGLKYLHEQGVLHRDIKGANILTTKDGMVKLADFGVAIKLSEIHVDEQDVVGSPYWIAPEIIEMSSPTSACDIWSVGCIVIELLTGKPPYFDLEPMAALFRIVQDDYPPFPDGISQALRDFLLNCFQKEPMMRSSAPKLLEHPWLHNVSTNSKLEEQKTRLARAGEEGAVGAAAGSGGPSGLMSGSGKAGAGLASASSHGGGGVGGAAASASIMNTIKNYQREVSPASDLASTSMEEKMGMGMGVRTAKSYELPPKSSPSSSSRRALMQHTSPPTPPPAPLPTSRPLAPEDTISVTSSTSLASLMQGAKSTVKGGGGAGGKGGNEVNSEILARHGLVKHDPPTHSTPPTPPRGTPSLDVRSMSPMSDDTSATKDRGVGAGGASGVGYREYGGGAESIGVGGADDDLSPMNMINTRSSFFQTMHSDDDEEEDWDTMVVDKTLSQSVDSNARGGGVMRGLDTFPSPTKAISTPIYRQGSRSSNASEHDGQSSNNISLKNRSMDLVARLKTSSLSLSHNLPTSMTPSLPPPFLSETRRAGSNNNNNVLSPNNMHSMLTKFAERVDEDNFDDMLATKAAGRSTKGSISLSDAGDILKTKPKRTFSQEDVLPDDLNSGFNTSSDTHEWRQKKGEEEDQINSEDSAPLHVAPVAKAQVRRLGTKESMDTIRTLSSDEDFDDLDFGDDDEVVDGDKDLGLDGTSNNFAVSLRAKLLKLNKTSTAVEEEDEFMNVQFDERDFRQNEQKDIHSRRSREVVDLLSRIRINSREQDIFQATSQVIDIFDFYPEQREHFISSHGLMPIIDMFESQSSIIEFYTSTHGIPLSSSHATSGKLASHSAGTISTSSSGYATFVLQIVNKIIEGSVRASEQLSLMGIIPIVMNLFERSARSSTPKNIPLAPFFSATPHYSSMSFSASSPRHVPVNTKASVFFTDDVGASMSEDEINGSMHTGSIGCIESVTMEAAKFVHQISLSSSITLQMLIGAGGLTVLTTMVSYGASVGKAPHSQYRIGEGIDQVESAESAGSSAEPAPSSLRASLPVNLGELSVNIPTPAVVTDEAVKAMCIFQMGLDCIAQLFSVQSSRTRDFCRLFVKLGLLSHLSIAFSNLRAMYYTMMKASCSLNSGIGNGNGDTYNLTTTSRAATHKRNESITSTTDSFITLDSAVQYNVQADDTPERIYCHMIATLFAKFSRSDSIVSETMASIHKGVIGSILDTLRMPELRTLSPTSMHTATPFTSRKHIKVSTLSPAYLEMIELCLKCLKNLSMEPSALDNLERAGAIETLVPLLCGPLSDRYIIYILPCIFNMCRINKRRQELASQLGIIPHLKRIISEGSHLRQFALPILFDFAHASNATRSELWKHDCVSFYVNLLKENYWQAFALNSLAVWIASDPNNVSSVLVQSSCISKLIDFFDKVSSQTLHSLHKPLLDIMSKSSELSTALSYSGIFIAALVRRLKAPQEAIVLRTLLKMLQLLHQHHACPRQFVLDHDLYALVKEFARSEAQVLVCQIANRLLMDFQLSTFT